MLKYRPASPSSSHQGLSHCVFNTPGLMGRTCPEGQHWDDLVRNCMDCNVICQQPQVDASCASYCESVRCKALPGHYYDILLRKCMKCAVICGKHPPECSQHCPTPPSTVTTKQLLVLTSPVQNGGGPSALEDSTIILYSLLAVCIVLLVSSLWLTLAVLLRGRKAKTFNARPAEGTDHRQKRGVPPRQELGVPGSQQGRRSNDLLTSSSSPTELSDDSSPTETCVCVHCFPDLKALGQGSDRPPTAPYSFYQPAVLHGAQVPKGGPLWTEGNLYTSGLEVREEAAVG